MNQIHPECEEWRIKYKVPDSSLYPEIPDDTSFCRACAAPLLCNGVNQQHKYKELTVAQAQAKGMSHFGNCYHVEECVRCGHIYSYDSSG